MYNLTFEQLLSDLNTAYFEARRGKRNKKYQIEYESNLCSNLYNLCTHLWDRTYIPAPGACFVIAEPKKREIFAAAFQDRIVHHLYFNYVHKLFERTFIADSYSCIVGRGTHYGIRRLRDHIRSESRAFTRPCYVLKLDIKGYFMHINRQTLSDIACRKIKKLAEHKVSKTGFEKWKDVIDIEFCLYLTKLISETDPLKKCIVIGDETEWDNLPKDKSLFYSPPGIGLPIGNLTSQLFSNVYLGEFDEYMKRQLHCKHYGRYVDDAYVVSSDRKCLTELIPLTASFLNEKLGLELHMGKVKIFSAYDGVEFLGAFLKPHTSYISKNTLARMKVKVRKMWHDMLVTGDCEKFLCQLASFNGVLGHFDSWNIRKTLGIIQASSKKNSGWNYI